MRHDPARGLRAAWLILTLGVLIGLGLGLAMPVAAPDLVEPWWRRPSSVVAAAAPTPPPPPTATPLPPPAPWTPQVAFQHYEIDDLDTAFVAEHVDWLMLSYGAEELRDDVRARGYSSVLPQYLLMFQIFGPGPLERSKDRCKDDFTPLRNNVMYSRDFCKLVHPHDDWFLHNEDGERLYVKERLWNGRHAYQYFMNPASEGFRSFWIAQVRRQGETGWDSLFLDNVAATYEHIPSRADNSAGGVAEYSSTVDWQEATVGMLRAIRAAFPERQLWGNIIEAPLAPDAWDRYRPELDGIQEESFATGWPSGRPLTPAAWAAMIARAERTLAAGKSVVLYGQGDQNDYDRMRFSLASYLLIATPDSRATFRYTHTSSYETLWWYPEYDMDLGLPEGGRYQDGPRWVRRFACATVWVDPERRAGAIEPRACAR